MKERIFTGWNFNRIFFLLMGILFIISSVQEFEWIGMLAGAYFAAMGIFSFGCAAGNCKTGD